jgi:hypothetical protein
MQSFGEGEILEHGTYLAGRVRVTGVRGEAALASRLCVRLGVQFQPVPGGRAGVAHASPAHTADSAHAPTAPRTEIRDVSGELHTGPHGTGLYVGRLLLVGGPRTVPAVPHGHETMLELACELSPGAVERLEGLRAGRALRLSLHVWFSAWRDGQPSDAFQARPFDVAVPHEPWLAVLDAWGHAFSTLLEFRFAPLDAVPFRAAVAQLRDADRDVARSEYAAAVGRCRLAYESVLREQPAWAANNGKGLWTALGPALAPRLAEHYERLAGVLKQLTAVPHHGFGIDVAFTRADAQLALTVTAALLAVLGEATVWLAGLGREPDAGHA